MSDVPLGSQGEEGAVRRSSSKDSDDLHVQGTGASGLDDECHSDRAVVETGSEGGARKK